MRVRREGDAVRVELEDFEVELLRQLPEGLRALLSDAEPDDPAIARLFPATVWADDDADAELRRLIYDDLLAARLDALDDIGAILDRGTERRGRLRVDLVEDEPALFLGVLNDIRLTLGARVGIEHLDRDRIDESHPAVPTLAVMDHLAWLQEQLLRVIDPASVGE